MSPKSVQQHLNRLSLLRGFPESEGALQALSEMLQAVCADEHEFHRAVSRWCETEQYVPTEAQLRFVVSTIRADEAPEQDPRAPRCSVCSGTGYERVFWLETNHRYSSGANRRERQFITFSQFAELRAKIPISQTWDQMVYDGVKLCQCDRGRAIQAARDAKEIRDHLGDHKAGKRNHGAANGK